MPNIVDLPEFRVMLDYWAKRGFASIGFSGSPNGMTPGQESALVAVLQAIRDTVGVYQFHHCGSKGGDETAHFLAIDFNAFVVVHPHLGAVYRVRSIVGHDTRVAWPALRATQDMVNEVSLAIAAPSMGAELLNIHTWDLVKLAKAKPIACITIAPETRMGGKGKF